MHRPLYWHRIYKSLLFSSGWKSRPPLDTDRYARDKGQNQMRRNDLCQWVPGLPPSCEAQLHRSYVDLETKTMFPLPCASVSAEICCIRRHSRWMEPIGQRWELIMSEEEPQGVLQDIWQFQHNWQGKPDKKGHSFIIGKYLRKNALMEDLWFPKNKHFLGGNILQVSKWSLSPRWFESRSRMIHANKLMLSRGSILNIRRKQIQWLIAMIISLDATDRRQTGQARVVSKHWWYVVEW